MKLSGQRDLPISPDLAWAELLKPDVLRLCVPGCQTLDQTDESAYAASIKLTVGPLKAVFKGSVTLCDLDPPNQCRIVGDGTGGVAGFAKGSAIVRLFKTDQGSALEYDAEVQIGGKLAAVGNRLFESVTKKNIDSFFDAFVQQVTSEAVG